MKRAESNSDILKRICRLKQRHPAWGYRRVWAYIRYRENIPVNRKRVHRLMRDSNLMVEPNWRLKASRKPQKSKIRAQRPDHVWGIDMTKIMVPSWGWTYCTVVLDWYTKKIVGYHLNITSKTQDWLWALDMAVNTQFPEGIRDCSLKPMLVSDNGCQPTSQRFMRDCNTLGIKQIFTSYNNPKGNADTERVIRTMKEDLVWTNEFQSVEQLKQAIDAWVIDYNTDYPHSAIGYMTPCEYERLQRAA